MKKQKFFSAKNVAMLGVLLALVVILQSVALVTGLFLATSLSFVLIPIVLGAVLIGPLAGGILGAAFGLMVLIFGISGADAFTAMLLNQNAWMTVLTCLVKGIAAGVVPGFLYRLIAPKNRYVAVFVASAAAPVMNTGFFILGALCMWQIFEELAIGQGTSVLYYIVVLCSAVNFAIEFASTVIAAPSLYRVTEVVKKRRAKEEILPDDAGGAVRRETPAEETGNDHLH